MPLHAASGVGYGEGFAANSHRYAPTGILPAIKYLVEELGADVNAADHEGNTPLHLAASRGDNETIRFLVSKGADVMRVNREGNTTVDMANGPVQRTQPYPGNDQAARETRRQEQSPMHHMLKQEPGKLRDCRGLVGLPSPSAPTPRRDNTVFVRPAPALKPAGCRHSPHVEAATTCCRPSRPRSSSGTAPACHSERGKAGGLSLPSFDAAHERASTAKSPEKMIRKLRAGMMPPAGRAPARAARVDGDGDGARGADGSAAALKPEPGLASVPAAEPRRVRGARSRTCWTSTSTSDATCRPTRSATASTTSPTRRASRRR